MPSITDALKRPHDLDEILSTTPILPRTLEDQGYVSVSEAKLQERC